MRRTTTFLRYTLRSSSSGNAIGIKWTAPQLLSYPYQSRRSFADTTATPSATKEATETDSPSSSSSAKSSKEEPTATSSSTTEKANPKVAEEKAKPAAPVQRDAAKEETTTPKVAEEKATPATLPPIQLDDNLLASLPPSAAVTKLCDDILVLNVVEMHMLLQLIQVSDPKSDYFWIHQLVFNVTFSSINSCIVHSHDWVFLTI